MASSRPGTSVEAGRFQISETPRISSAKNIVSAVKANLLPKAVDAFVAHEDIEPTHSGE